MLRMYWCRSEPIEPDPGQKKRRKEEHSHNRKETILEADRLRPKHIKRMRKRKCKRKCKRKLADEIRLRLIEFVKIGNLILQMKPSVFYIFYIEMAPDDQHVRMSSSCDLLEKGRNEK